MSIRIGLNYFENPNNLFGFWIFVVIILFYFSSFKLVLNSNYAIIFVNNYILDMMTFQHTYKTLNKFTF